MKLCRMSIVIECSSDCPRPENVEHLKTFIRDINSRIQLQPRMPQRNGSKGISKFLIQKIRNYLIFSKQLESTYFNSYVWHSNLSLTIFLELRIFESSEVYQQTIGEINEIALDEHGFSFSSIGDEFDFTIEVDENKPVNSINFEESDLIFESSQNFY